MESLDLNKHEFGCLIMRERGVSVATLGFDHPNHCRFCKGELFSRRELREAGLVLDADGQPVPIREVA